MELNHSLERQRRDHMEYASACTTGQVLLLVSNPKSDQISDFISCAMCIYSRFVTESRKTVPNHTFLFQNIYYWNMNTITFSKLFHKII